jgi:hypothetical protein
LIELCSELIKFKEDIHEKWFHSMEVNTSETLIYSKKPSIPYKTSSFNEARVSASSTVQERDPETRHG